MADATLQQTSAVLRPDDVLLAAHPALYGATPQQRVVSLAHALASSPPWQRLRHRARLVVRPAPHPTIAVIGAFDSGDQPLLDALGWQVPDTLRRLRPIDYAEVERAVVHLADQLMHRLTAEELRRCRLVGIPRGGLVVAGLLSYALGLTHGQLGDDPAGDDQLVVVVDDCMLSGARLRRWLRTSGAAGIVLAQLHSHPDLRAAVERDPAVVACLGAVDLHDHAPEQHGADYPQWKARWTERSPDDYWTGHTDHVCYPWNEPDTLVWNAPNEQAEPGWRVVPPDWCLKNRREGRDAAEDVQLCGQPRAISVSPTIIWADAQDEVIVADAAHAEALQLHGVAADFWRALVAAPDVPSAAARLQEMYAAPPEQLRADLETFMAALQARGIATAGACEP